MNRPRTLVALLALFAAGVVFSASARSAHAQRGFQYQQLTYKVQVEYWFFDTTSYHWSTVYESSNRDDALFIYYLLMAIKEDGNLNEVVPNSYWRYIAVDVRMTTVYRYPRVQSW